jgi:hypothetical protein
MKRLLTMTTSDTTHGGVAAKGTNFSCDATILAANLKLATLVQLPPTPAVSLAPCTICRLRAYQCAGCSPLRLDVRISLSFRDEGREGCQRDRE